MWSLSMLRRFVPYLTVFLAMLATLPAWGAKLVPEKASIAVGETMYIRLDADFSMGAQWSASGEGKVDILSSDTKGATIKGVAAGDVTINVKWLTGKKSTKITVTGAPVKPTTTGGRTGSDISDPDMRRIGDLLNRYKDSLGSLEGRFSRQDSSTEGRKPDINSGDQATLVSTAESFFRELGGMGYSLKDLQRFRSNFMAAGSGGSPLFPGQGDWDRTFLGVERALMMGRAIQVQQLWMETLRETFRENPNAAVFGEIDIGSWVKMQLSGLGFPADIDFSSVSIDPALNRYLVDKFEAKLKQHTSLDMVQADALLTAHGQATPDVFIGDWGKTFAELDMLKRSKWKVLRPVFANGELIRIDTVEKPGAQLFWEVAFRKLEAGQFAEVKFPQMDLAKEPMLSLEMLRHGIHDIEHGPYSRGQQLIKMLKYAERSYFMNKKAVAEFGFNPYDANDAMLADVADKVIKNKDNPAVVADLLRGLAGEEITEDNVNAVTTRLLERAKIAMHDNATRALAFRLNKIAKTDNDERRQAELDRLWHDLETEIRTFQDSVGKPPAVMVRALELVKAVMEGKLPTSELEAKSNELHQLLSDAYKLPNSVIDRILVSDSYIKVRNLLRKLGWIDTQIDKFVETAKKKYPRGAQVADAIKQLNDQLNKTTAGSGLLKATDWADNAFTVYEAFMGGGNPNEAMWNASLAMGRIGLQEAFPSLAIPLSIYDGFKTGSPKPVAMAVAFYYFPFAGQTYMVSQQLQRVDVAMRDSEFYGALGKVMNVTDFDTEGRIVRFHLMQATGKQELDSADISPAGNRKAIVELFSHPESTFYTASNFRYWASLVPKVDDRFGRYEDKLQKLRRFFAHSEDVRYMTLMLENFKAQTDKLPQDKFTAERQSALERMEQQLQEAVWVAMADLLESSAKSAKSSELEVKVKKLEEDLNLRDDDLGKDKGLLSRIKWEIRQNSSLWSGENPYAVGVIYEKYIKAYEQVAAIRNDIVLNLWNRGYGVDYSAAQGKPMKIILMGGKSGAPQLTGEPEADLALAEKTREIHRQRGDKIRADLENALSRPIDDAKDRKHLAGLGQIGFEWEHLIDDCPGRLSYQGSEEVQTALRDRQDKYKAYLAKLAEGRPRIYIEGPAQVEIGKPATLKARVENLDPATLKRMKYAWRESALRGKLEAKGDGATFTSPAPGSYKLLIELQQPANGTSIKLAEAFHDLKVGDAAPVRLTISGPSSGEVGKTLSFSADVSAPAEVRNGLRLAWSSGGRSLGSGGSASFGSSQAGTYRITLAAFQKGTDGKEAQVAGAEHSITLTAKPKDDKKDPKTTTPDGQADATGAAGKTDQPGKAKQGAGGSASGQFPGEPFNGMQISYSFSGCSLPEMTDKPGFTTSRTYKGRLGSGTMTVSGTARMGSGYGATLSVTVSAGGEQKEHKAYIKSGWPGFNTNSFNLTIPIPPTATNGGFGIRMDGEYNAGGRGLVVSGSCSTDGPEGDAPRGTGDLSVDVTGPNAPVPLGKEAEVSANAKGGRFPYSYSWTGAVGENERAKAKITRPGSQQVTVTVSDSEGKRAGANLTIKVAPLKLELAGLPGQAYYGSRSRLQVNGLPDFQPAPDPCAGRSNTSHNPFDECTRVKVDPSKAVSVPPQFDDANPPPPIAASSGTPARTSAGAREGAYRFIWQSEPGLTFDPSTSTDGATWVTFDRMGQVKVWCEVHQMIEGAWQTIGETEQKTVNVVAPAFTINFTPPDGQGKIGQEVSTKIVAKPEVPAKLIDYRWFEPASSNRMEYTDNAGEIGFKVKDAKPMKLEALARVPHHGDEIAKITGSYTGVAYDVKIGPPKARGPQLQVWVCDTQLGNAKNCGMRDIPQGQFVTFQDILLQAQVTPAPPSPRYRWTVDPSGSCGLPGAGSELRLNCSNTGTYTVRLQVTDADNLLLGQAETAVSVSVNENDVRQAPKSKEAYDKMLQAKQRANDGQLDEAINLASAATGLDPKNAEAKDLGKRWNDERKTVQQQIDRAKKALQGNKPDDAQKEIDAAKKLHPKYPPVLDAEKQLADKRKGLSVKPSGDGTPQSGGATGVEGKPVSSSGSGASLSLDGDVIEPGGKLTLRWNAPADMPDNAWVGLIPSDKPHGSTAVNDQHDMTYQYIGKARGGSMTFTAPAKEGSYDLRLSNPANDRELASITFRVHVAGTAASLKLAKAVYAPSEPVELSFTASAGYPKNSWVGLIPSDKPHGKTSVNDQYDMAYQYVDGRAQGSMTFTAPAMEGSYDLRMNETSNDLEVASVSFTVAVPVEGTELALAKAAFKPGETIHLRFKASGLLPRNSWVGLIPSDKPHGKTSVNDQHDVAYRYLDGRTSGEMEFTAPATEGSWDLRLNETSNDREIASITFRVDKNAPVQGPPVKSTIAAGAISGPVSSGITATPTTPAGGRDGASLRLERVTYRPGEPIAVQFTAPASWPGDAWIGIVPSTIPHGDERQNDNHDITYQYLNKRTSGTLSFTAPAAGDWDFRLHDTDNNGKEYASVSFRVGAAVVPGGHDSTAAPVRGGLIFEVGNTGGVSSGPTRATAFNLATPHMITLIRDYHWNSARGAKPGSIAVRDASGRIWGPWPATGSAGQGGVANASWTSHPNAVLPAGTYTVIDSDPASWSHNAESNNRGFVRVEGYPTDVPATAPSTGDTKAGGVLKEVDELLDAVKSLKGLFGK